MIHDDIKEILLDNQELDRIVKELAERINEDYKDKEILFVVILKGSLVFASDLMRYINRPVKIDFLQVSSYGDKTSSDGGLIFKKEIETNIGDKHVLLIEDIVDSGNTLSKLKQKLEQLNPASLKICTLLSKPARRQVDVLVDYIGTEIPDEFVVGYGLDFAEVYRNLPYLGVLKPLVYKN